MPMYDSWALQLSPPLYFKTWVEPGKARERFVNMSLDLLGHVDRAIPKTRTVTVIKLPPP